MSCPVRPGCLICPASRPPRPRFMPGPPSQRGSVFLPHEAPQGTCTEVGEAHLGCGQGGGRPGGPAAPQHLSHGSGQAQTPRCSGHSFKAVTAGRSSGSGPFCARTRLCRGHSPWPELPPSPASFQHLPPHRQLCPHWPEGPSKTKSHRVPLPVIVHSVSPSPWEFDPEFSCSPGPRAWPQPHGWPSVPCSGELAPTPRLSPVL